MKIEIQDVEAVRAIRPVDAALYLRAKGWQQIYSQPGRASTWIITAEDEEYEALLPMDDAAQYREAALSRSETLSDFTDVITHVAG